MLHLLVNLSSNNLNNVLISRDKSQKSTIARPNLAVKQRHPYNLYLVFRNLTKFIYLRKEPNHNFKTTKPHAVVCRGKVYNNKISAKLNAKNL